VRGESKAKVALNVRAGPSLSSAIVAVLAPGGSYRILRWFYGWAHVRLAHGGIGWISGSALRSAAATTASVRTRRSSSGAKKSGSAAAGPFVTAGVRVHSGPSLNSPAIGLVATGTHVHLLGSVAGWAKVRLPTRQIGYILGIYVAA
jgi:uncharacterized protein YgiM (DUF1202 family)